MFQIKYFTFVDPVTGAPTKGYGYSYTHVKQNVVVKRKGKEVDVVKNRSEEETRNIFPKDAIEISKKEFDDLDVSGESLLSQFNREKQFLHIQKLEKRFRGDIKPVSSEEIVKRFK